MARTPELIIEEIDIESEYKDEISSLQSALDLERRTNARLIQRVAELENEILMLRLPKACEQCKIYCQLLDELQKKTERREQEMTAEATQNPGSHGLTRAVYSNIQPLPAHAITCEEIEPLLYSLSKQSPCNQSPNNKRSPRPRSGSAARTRTPKSRSGSAKAGGRSGSTRGGHDSSKVKRSPGTKRATQGGLRSAKIGAQMQDHSTGKKRSSSKSSAQRGSQANAAAPKQIKFGF